MGYEDECAFVGSDFCEEELNARGLDKSEEELKFFGEF